jgi:hypothetical protein
MMDWEKWFRSAAEPPSDHEDSKRNTTEDQIRDALRNSPALEGRPYRIYVKGSYANNTNVRLDYDVDIAIEYEGYFYSDLVFDLEGTPKEDVGIVTSDDPYDRSDFKRDIRAALEDAFGSSAIEDGNIAFRVREGKTTLPADVVPCWQYRRYDRVTPDGTPVFHEGAKIFPKTGSSAVNYPQQQKDSGINKNKRTGYRYKRMVRVMKKLQTRLLDAGTITNALPSYAIECLVFNVDDDSFNNTSYRSDVRAVLASIFNETLSTGGWNDWEEVNGLKYLFRGGQPWTHGQAHTFASAAWDEIGFD